MRVDNMIVRAHDQEDTSRNRTLVGLGPNYVHAVHQPTPNRSRATGGGDPHMVVTPDFTRKTKCISYVRQDQITHIQ
jgi:hypothetical protein